MVKTFFMNLPTQVWTLPFNETKLTLKNAYSQIYLRHEVKKQQTMFKEPPFVALHKLLTCLLTLSSETRKYNSRHIIFIKFLLFLEIKTKIIRFCTKFQVKKNNFLQSKFPSLLLHSKTVQRNCLHFSIILKHSLCSKG